LYHQELGSQIQTSRESARRRLPRWLIPALGYSVSIICLIWVYYGFDWKKELPRLAATDWRWVSLAIVADIAVYVCQGFRWSRLLSPLAKVSPWKTTQAVYIGLFANEVLPLRSGEIIRCYLQRRWTGLPLSVVISSAVIERLVDGVWLVVGFWGVSQFVELPGFLQVASQVLMVLLGLLAVLLGLAIWYKPAAKQALSGSRWSATFHHLLDGVHVMGSSRSFIAVVFMSLLYLALQVLPILFLMIGYGMELSPWAAVVVLVVLRLGTVVPQAPGNVGSFQALTILGLKVFGLDRGDATGFATLLFLVVTVPLWMAGFVALIATRMRLDDIHRDAHESIR
jgi:uncharacterized protein (TIRG00374 family)